MKIIHLITGLDLGGAERQLATLVEDKTFFHNMENIVVSLKDEGVIGKYLISKGISVYCLNLHKSWGGFWQGLRYLGKLLRKEKPDIIQTWLYHADLLGFIFGKLARVRCVIWNIRCSNMNFTLYSRVTAWIFNILAILSPFPKAIIVNSLAGQAFHQQRGYKPKQWVNIPNGIDTVLFHPESAAKQTLRQLLNIPAHALVMGMVGRVDPMKDYTTFLKAVKQLAQEFPDMHCIIAGKGTVEAVWRDVPPRLHRLGAWGNMPDLMNALDVFVLSSVFGEGFPNVVGEAMACAVPVITTDVGDAALIVQNQNQIVCKENSEDLAGAIRRLLNLSSHERKLIGQAGRQRIIDHFSVPLMRQGYQKFYKEVFSV